MFDANNIEIFDELESLLPPLTDRQMKNLEESLIEEGGAYSDLWIWVNTKGKGVLVDGHNRYKLCRQHDLPFGMKRVFDSAKTIEEVMYRMRKAAVGQRNLADALEQHHIGQMILYRVKKKGDKPTDAVKEVSEDVGISERQCWRDYDRAKITDAMPKEVRTTGVHSLGLKDLKKFDLLNTDEQLATIDRTGDDANKIASEMRRMATVKGTPLYSAEKAEQKQRAEKEREAAKKKGLFVVCLEYLGKANKAMLSIKSEHKIPTGKFSRVHDLMNRLDEKINAWKKEAAEKENADE